MISDKAFTSIQRVMRGLCLFKVVPYNWDPVTCHLSPITKWSEKLLHNFHRFVTYGITLYSLFRFLQALSLQRSKAVVLTPRVAAMNILWGLAYGISGICFQQFRYKEASIRYFSNELFDHINSLKRIPRKKNVKKGMDYFSKIVILSGLMLVINPPFHSIMMIDTPCAPHFSSSIWLSCGHVEEDSHPLLDKTLFIFLETYFAFLIFLPLSFNWTLIYVGLGWIRTELKELRNGVTTGELDESDIVRKYRNIQCISGLINDSFRFYLQWFPSILLGIVSFLIYATIKFVDVGWRAYGMFPSCLIRCSFESFTPLFIAGKVNQSSSRFLKQWTQAGIEREDKISMHRQSGYRSCKVVECTAGGMYTFENSILLTSVSNCVLLTMNLLLLRG